MEESAYRIKQLNGILEEFADRKNIVGKLSRFMLTGGFGSFRYTNEFIDPNKTFLAKESFLDLNCSSFEKRNFFDFSKLSKSEPSEIKIKNLNTDLFKNKKVKDFKVASALDFNFIVLAKEAIDKNLNSTILLEVSISENLTASDLLDNHTEETDKKIAILNDGKELKILEKINFETLEVLRAEIQNMDSFLSEYEDTLLKYNHLEEPVEVNKKDYMKNILKITNKSFWKYVYRTFETNTPYSKQFETGINLNIEKLSKSKEEPRLIFSNFSKYLKGLFEEILANELIANNLVSTTKLIEDKRKIEVKKIDYTYEKSEDDNFQVEVEEFYIALNSLSSSLKTMAIENGELVIFKNTPTKDEIVKLVNRAKESTQQIFVIILKPESEIPKGDLFAVNNDVEILTTALQAASFSDKFDLDSLKNWGMLALIEDNKHIELKFKNLPLHKYIEKITGNYQDLSGIERELITFRDYLDFPEFLKPIIKLARKENSDFKSILGKHYKFLISNSKEIASEFNKIMGQKNTVKLNLEACMLIRTKDKESLLSAGNKLVPVNEASTLSKALVDLQELCQKEPTIVTRLNEFKENFKDRYKVHFDEFLSNKDLESSLIDAVCDDFVETLEKIQSNLIKRKKTKNKNKQLSFEIGKIKQRFLALNALEYLKVYESMGYLLTLEENFKPSPFNTFVPENVIYTLPKDEMVKLINLVDVDDLEDQEEQKELQLTFLQSFSEMKFIKLENDFRSFAGVIKNFKEKYSNFLFRGLIICEEFEKGLAVSNSGKYAVDTDAGIIYAKYEN